LEKSISTDTISSGLKAYNAGLKHDAKSQHQKAVDSFTRAINSGYSNINVYIKRGCSLQILNLHEPAIQDFSKAISHRPDDCYSFFLRSVSYYKTGVVSGAILDIKKAIILSLTESEINDEYREVAMKLGWGTHTNLYEVYLNNYRKSMD
jgi:tetratricopeptide (TPR) repeat protein